jgi:hypothetical protein
MGRQTSVVVAASPLAKVAPQDRNHRSVQPGQRHHAWRWQARKTVDGEVVPILSLYSSYDDGDACYGVNIGGAFAFYGQIVAPYSTMDVTGSGGFYGAANVGKALISGAGGFHFDERFLELRIAPPGGSSNKITPQLEAWGETI